MFDVSLFGKFALMVYFIFLHFNVSLRCLCFCHLSRLSVPRFRIVFSTSSYKSLPDHQTQFQPVLAPQIMSNAGRAARGKENGHTPSADYTRSGPENTVLFTLLQIKHFQSSFKRLSKDAKDDKTKNVLASPCLVVWCLNI